MELTPLDIHGAHRLTSPVHGDDRGFFREWFKLEELEAQHLGWTVAQANLSQSARGVVRGLHYSLAPEGQAKVVTCAGGELDEALVDVRQGSPTFGAVEYLRLRGDAGDAVLVPAGVAHGFCVQSESATLVYLLSSPYRPDVELTIYPFDPALKVPWAVPGAPTLSARDAAAPSMKERRERGELPQF